MFNCKIGRGSQDCCHARPVPFRCSVSIFQGPLLHAEFLAACNPARCRKRLIRKKLLISRDKIPFCSTCHEGNLSWSCQGMIADSMSHRYESITKEIKESLSLACRDDRKSLAGREDLSSCSDLFASPLTLIDADMLDNSQSHSARLPT